MMRKQNKGSDFLPHANSEKFGAVNHSDVTNLSLRARQDKLLTTAEYYSIKVDGFAEGTRRKRGGRKICRGGNWSGIS